MLAMSQPGDRYQQEYWEEEAEDWAKVNRLNGKVADEYAGCLVTKECTPLEPRSIEHKYYCPTDEGSALVFIEELKGKTVAVELIGADFDFAEALPGEGAEPGVGVSFPALDDMGSCVIP